MNNNKIYYEDNLKCVFVQKAKSENNERKINFRRNLYYHTQTKNTCNYTEYFPHFLTRLTISTILHYIKI